MQPRSVYVVEAVIVSSIAMLRSYPCIGDPAYAIDQGIDVNGGRQCSSFTRRAVDWTCDGVIGD